MDRQCPFTITIPANPHGLPMMLRCRLLPEHSGEHMHSTGERVVKWSVTGGEPREDGS